MQSLLFEYNGRGVQGDIMNNTRIMQVIELLNKSEDYMAIQELAKRVGVSYGTLRSDLDDLESLLPEDARIIRKTGVGVKMLSSSETVSRLKNDLLGGLNSSYATPGNRVIYISLRLLLSLGAIRVSLLCNELHVSASTIQHDLDKVKKILQNYKIKLERKQNSPMSVIGSERRIRNCAIDLLRRDPCMKDIIDLVVGNSGLREDDFPIPYLPVNVTSIKELIEAYLSNPTSYWHSIPLRSSTSLFVALLLTCYRATQGHSVMLSNEFIDYLKKQPLYDEIRAIVGNLNARIGITLSEMELRFLQVHLLAQQSDLRYQNEEQGEAAFFAKKIISNWNKTFDLTISSSYFVNMLADYLRSAILRMRHGLPSSNPLLAVIKNRYPLLFEKSFSDIVAAMEELEIQIPAVEAGSITLFLLSVLERKQEPVTALFVCHLDRGVQEFLKSRIEAHIQEICIQQTCSYPDFSSMDLSQFDLVISTIHLKTNYDIPVFVIPAYLEEEDSDALRKRVCFIQNNKAKNRYLQ